MAPDRRFGALLLLCSSLAFGQAQVFGPVPYLKPIDTPAAFANGANSNIEDFEDAQLTPDLIIPGAIVTPSTVTDSVDYDDGALDGLGRQGHSLQGTGVVRIELPTRPTFAGLVWTDGPGAVTFTAFGPTGAVLATSGPHTLADGSNTGATAEDRFFGVRDAGGIGAIQLSASGGIEIDHVQWQINNSLAGNTGSFAAPNPSILRHASVIDMHRLANGQTLIAGLFEQLGGTPRAAIARLNADLSVDTSFQQAAINPDVFVRVLPDPNGKVYVQEFNRLRRLNADGSVDTSFPQANFTGGGRLAAITLVSDGILAAGAFTGVNGQTRNGLAKLGFDGSLSAFNLATQSVLTVLNAGSDQVFIAGAFDTVGGLARKCIAKINTGGSGSVVIDWNAQLDGASSNVRSIASDGTALYISGVFASIQGSPRVNLAKLALSNGALDANWRVNATPNTAVETQRLHAIGGSVFASGGRPRITYSVPAGTSVLRQIAKLSSSSGAPDVLFDPQIDGTGSIAILPGDGGNRLLIGGDFLAVNGTTRLGLAQLNANGSTDLVLTPASATRAAAVRQVAFDEPNQRVYLMGDFSSINGVAIASFARLSQGTVDTVWRPAAAVDAFSSFVFRAGAGVFVEGTDGLSRLSEVDGSVVPGFSNSSPISALLNTNLAIYISGSGGTQRLPIAGNGSADPACAGAGRVFAQLAFDEASNALFGLSNDGQTVQKLNGSTCALDTAFNVVANSLINNLALDGKGGLWLGGQFTTINGLPALSPARVLTQNGNLDTLLLPTPANNSFNVGLGFHRGFYYGTRVTTNGDTVLQRMPATGGALDASWRVAALQGFAQTIAFAANRALAGGDFSGIGSSARTGYAELPLQERVLQAGFE